MIRAIRDQDIPVCLSWYNWYISHTTITFEEEPLSFESFQLRVKQITSVYPWIVLEEEGSLKGYACLDMFNTRTAYRFSADVTVYLDPGERGKGYGTALMKTLEECAKQQNIHKLISLVTAGNTASQHLHESLGYRKAAVMEHVGYKFGSWLDVIWYEKDLMPFEENPGEFRSIHA